jgi:hypothetical protein
MQHANWRFQSPFLAHYHNQLSLTFPCNFLFMIVIVSLPRGWIQEIKRMTVHISCMDYFLPAHRKSSVFTSHASRYIYKCTTIFKENNPLVPIKLLCFSYLESQLLCLWWRIPIHPFLWSVNNCPTLWLLPLSPFHAPQFIVHYLHRWHQQSRLSLSGQLL